MRIYRVQGPDGKIYKLEGPEGASKEQVMAALEAKLGGLPITPDRTATEALTTGVKRGWEQFKSTMGDIIPAMAAKAIGADEYARMQMEEAAATQRQIQETMPAEFQSYKQVTGPYSALKYAAETVGENVPNIAASLIPGGVGGVAGRRLALGAAERTGLLGAEELATAGAQGAARGQIAGVYLGSYAQNAPEVFQNIYEKTGQMEVPTSLLFGAASAALDSVLPATVLSKLTGPMKVGIVEKILEKSGMDRGLLRSTTAGIISGVPAEGLTEGAQEAISIAAEKFVASNPQIFESKDWERIMEASVRGAIAGGAFGGVGGGVEGARAGAERRAQYQSAQERRAERQRQSDLRRQGETIEGIPGQDAQMQLPGFEMGPATTLYTAKEAEKTAKEKLQGRQGELFTPEGKLTTAVEKAATKDEKRAAIQERERQKREAAESKASQERLRKLVSGTQLTLPGFEEETLKQRRAADEAAAGYTPEGPQGDLFAAPTTTEQPAGATPTGTEETIAEPTVRTKPEPLTPTTVGSVINDGTLKALGIGHTALIRKNKLLDGKDISNPEDAAEVKRILDAYLDNKKLSEKIRNSVEEYLARPEFSAAPQAEEVINEQGITEPVSGPIEPSVATGGAERKPAGGGSAERVTEPVGAGLGVSRVPAELSDVREEPSEPALTEPTGKKAETDKQKAEAGAVQAKEEKRGFIADNDRRINNFMNGMLREESAKAGLSDAVIPSEDYTGSEAHSMLRLPALYNDFFRLQDVLARGAEPLQRAKNEQELKMVSDAIAESGQDAVDTLNALQQTTPAQRERLYSEINKIARNTFAEDVKARVASLKEAEESKSKKANLRTELSDEAFIEDFAKRFEAKTGTKLFLPEFRGPELDEAGRAAVDSGNISKVIDHLRGTITNPTIKQILHKIKSLNLNAKVVTGSLDGKAGAFDPTTNTITVDPTNGMNQHTILHELLHAAVSHVLRNPKLTVTQNLTSLFVQLQNQLGAAYGAQDIQEFAAEVFSNPEFQALLKTLKAPRSGNMFQRIMQAVAEFFGFRKGETAYDAGIKLVSQAVDMSADVPPSAADMLFLGTPNAISSGFNTVGQIGQAMPELAGRTLEATKNFLSNTPPNLLKYGMGLLRIDNLNTIYGKQLPAIQTLLTALEKRNGTQEARIQKVNDNYKRFLKVSKQFPAAMEKMNDMAYDSRLAEVDVLDPNFKPSPTQINEYSRLKSVYNSLPKEVQQVYKDIRGAYVGAIDEYEKLLLSSVTPSLASKLRAEYQARKRGTAYIPFLRRGDFWVEYEDPQTGERAASAFESIRERDRFVKDVLKGAKHKLYQNIQNAAFVQGSVPPTSFIGKVMADLTQQGASQEQLNSVYQAYLALFPGQSIAKQFMKSENVRGMERDIVRGYGDVMLKWSRKLANSEYAPQIDRAISEIQAQAENQNDPAVTAAAQNIVDQRGFMQTPTFGALTHAATSLSYTWYIAGNVSSALVNLSTLPMFSYPVLGAKFGFDRAGAALLRASKAAINGLDKNPRYAALVKELNDHSQLEHTMSREVLEGRRSTTKDYLGLKARIMDGLSLPFAATERLNRGATAVAAYELALQKGMGQQEAIKYALQTVKDINTSGLSATAPKYMQHPIGRVFFTFKSFAWNSAFMVARAFHQAFKGETKEVQREARRQLLGIYGMAMAFAGAKGLPFMGAASTLATMINALFGDDDEPYDFHASMQDFMGELAYKGAVNQILNLEISNRVGVAQDLLFRDDPKGVSEQGYVLTAMKQAFGPAGSFATSVGTGVEMMSQGNVERGIEAMTPSFIRNGLKGIRYMREGALTLKGEPVDEDIDAYNSLMQVIGFSPADLSSKYEANAILKGREKKVLDRRALLLDKYDMARTAGDADMMVEAREEINEFNSKHPGSRISSDTLQKSAKARKAAEQNSINGVTYNKKMLPELRAYLEELED